MLKCMHAQLDHELMSEGLAFITKDLLNGHGALLIIQSTNTIIVCSQH